MKKVYANPMLGEKFNSWTVISEPFSIYRVHRGVRCRCECGTEKDVMIRYISLGMSKSCGKCNQEIPNIGKSFGRWIVDGIPVRKDEGLYIPCKCSCGKEKLVYLLNLTDGKTKSCGCWRPNQFKTHGDTKKSLYWVWQSMKQRCNYKLSPIYSRYGGRGISVCAEWTESYFTFRNWALANGYNETLTIDRINNNGNYAPSNCRWITQKENCRNTSKTHFITAFGETKCIKEWFEDPRCKVAYQTLVKRIHDGWETLKAITQPVKVY